jgi:Tfp pilus assembly protein PilN
MRVRLNLATKPMETHRRFLAGAGLSAFAAAIVFLALGWHAYSVRTAAAEVRARTEKMRQEFAKYEAQRQELERYFSQKEIASLHDRAAFINGIIDARSFNWTQMFMDLEHTLPGGVRVIRIEPKQVGGNVEVKLTVGAANDEAKLNFLHILATSKHFSNVQEQSDVSPNAGNNLVGDQRVVQLTATYSGT